MFNLQPISPDRITTDHPFTRIPQRKHVLDMNAEYSVKSISARVMISNNLADFDRALFLINLFALK
jgi:hypothetical protein